MNLKPCPFCKALVPDIEGPTHAYIGGSPGCWKIYGEVLAREYSDPEYFKVHRLTVDSYAVQHPGVPERRSSQSVTVHLLSLYFILETGIALDVATQNLGNIIHQHHRQFDWLEPPQHLGDITVLDIRNSTDLKNHCDNVHLWAKSVWNAWGVHHATIKKLAHK